MNLKILLCISVMCIFAGVSMAEIDEKLKTYIIVAYWKSVLNSRRNLIRGQTFKVLGPRPSMANRKPTLPYHSYSQHSNLQYMPKPLRSGTSINPIPTSPSRQSIHPIVSPTAPFPQRAPSHPQLNECHRITELRGQFSHNWPNANHPVHAGIPEYQIFVKGLDDGLRVLPNSPIKVVVKVHNKKQKTQDIGEFSIKVTNDGDSCGLGNFINGKNLAVHCSGVFLKRPTNELKRYMVQYNTPACGCFTLRASIANKRGEVFYDTETTGVTSLTKNICVIA